MLSGAHAPGTATILRRSHVHLSPCIGLITCSSRAVLANAHSLGSGGNAQQLPVGWAATVAMALELFAAPRPGAPLRRTRSRSAASCHLTSAAAGHVLGLGLSCAPPEHVASTLRDACGIVSNRVEGEWTGVSLARYRRLVDIIASDSRHRQLTGGRRFGWGKNNGNRPHGLQYEGRVLPMLRRCCSMLQPGLARKASWRRGSAR